MQTKYGFTLMTIDEFESWIKTVSVSRYINILQVHHTYSPAYAQFNGSNHFSMQQGMKSYHVNDCKYIDIAQNLTTFPDGTIMTGRSLNTAPAGCVGANTNGICVENVGNFDKGGDTMTQAQKDTIVRAYAAMCKRFNLSPETAIRYHGWYTAGGTYLGTYNSSRSAKTCPGTMFFGGNTRASYDQNLKPLIIQAMNGTYKKEDDEVIEKIKIFNCANKKEYEVNAIQKNGNNFVKLRDLASAFNCLVGYDAAKDLPSFDTMPVNDVNVIVNGENEELRGIFRQNGTNYIAIRDVLENVFGVPHDAILWDQETRTITVEGTLEFKYTPKDE